MAKLSASERQAQIVELLSNNGTMKIMELANHFQVSRETIRRDLIVLNEAGAVKKWFGGAIPMYDFETKPIDTRIKEREDSKSKICEKAFELLRDRSVLYLDTGSTTLYLAKLLKGTSGHTIISNSIPVINELIGSNNQLIITGGSVNQQVMSAMGSQTISFLECIKIDTAVLGSSGFARHKGPTSNTFDDCQIKKTVIQNAETNIVLADSRKATYSSLTQYANWRDIDYLITDSELSDEAKQQLEKLTDVVLA
ncbi:MAG: DeoR/GlpR family DNA-binding transcription regulator [Clostridiales bacterium]|nr:DeoR/GlpR family DNA-binding transcription regulator [Clostridiales bacterium]